MRTRLAARSGREAVMMVVAAIVFGVPAGDLCAQLPHAVLEGVFPPGGKAGTTFEAETAGDDLDEVRALRFSHPGITAKQKMREPDEFHNEPRPVENTFVVTIAEDVPAGTYEARVVGRYGISNPRAFVVGTREETIKQGDPDSPEDAMPIEVGTTVNARVDDEAIDYYTFQLEEGQRVLIDCRGRRIDSRISAVLKLLAPDGRILRQVRDVERGDPIIDCTAPQSGRYLLAVYDFLYRGGREYPYRLTIDSRPYIDFVFPPVGEPGSSREFTVYGRNLPGGKPAGESVGGVPLEKATVNVTLPGDEDRLHRLPVATLIEPKSGLLRGKPFTLKGTGGESNPAIIQYATAPIVLEQEGDNGEPERAQSISVPCEFVGRLYPRHDRDWVAFEAKRGEKYWINLLSNRLGSNADPTLLVQRVTTDDNGNEQVRRITAVDDKQRNNDDGLIRTESDDPQYVLSVDQDAVYRIRIKDLYGNPAADPRLVYRLLIHDAQPDFDILAYVDNPVQDQNDISPSSAVVRRGGTTVVRLDVFRRSGYRGRIEVTADGLPESVKCPPAIMEGDVETGWLAFTAEENAKPWSGPIRLKAEAEIDGQRVSRPVRTASLVWDADDGQPSRSRLVRDLTLSVIDAEEAPLLIEAAEGKTLETAWGGKLEIPVKVTKRGQIKGNLKVDAPELHNDIDIDDQNINGGSGKLELEVRDDDVPTGIYTFYLRGETRLRYERNQDAVKRAEKRQKELQQLVGEFKKQENESKQKREQANQQAQQAAEAVKDAQQDLNQAKKKAEQAAERVEELEKKLAEAEKAGSDDKDNQDKAEAVKQTQQQLDEAKKQSEQAAEQRDEAQKAVEEATKKNQEAQKAQQQADKQAEQAEDRREQAERMKREADNRLRDVRNRNKPRDINISVASTPVRLKITEHPVKVEFKVPEGPLKQGEQIEVTLSVQRLYGFDEKIDVNVDLPNGLKGVKVDQQDLDKNKTEVPIRLSAEDDATAGQHEAEVRLRFRFGRVNHDFRRSFVFEVEETDAKE